MFRNISKAEKQEFESEFLDEVVEEEDLGLEFITVKECMQSVHVLYYTLTTKVCNNKVKALQQVLVYREFDYPDFFNGHY